MEVLFDGKKLIKQEDLQPGIVPFEKKKETVDFQCGRRKGQGKLFCGWPRTEDCLSKKRARSGILSKKKMNVGDGEDPDDGGDEDSDGSDGGGGGEEDPPPQGKQEILVLIEEELKWVVIKKAREQTWER
jgi:hypothetical protein